MGATDKTLLEPFCDRVAGKVLAEFMLARHDGERFPPGAILIPGQVSSMGAVS
jgi:hypothetical protein